MEYMVAGGEYPNLLIQLIVCAANRALVVLCEDLIHYCNWLGMLLDEVEQVLNWVGLFVWVLKRLYFFILILILFVL